MKPDFVRAAWYNSGMDHKVEIIEHDGECAIVLPAQILTSWQLSAGDELEYRPENDGIRLFSPNASASVILRRSSSD